MIQGLHHIQLAIPQGGEDLARIFYGQVLGFEEIEKPESLRDRGGIWLATAGVEVHPGVQEPFAPAKKAHPAFRVSSLDEAIRHLSSQGISFRRDIDVLALRRIYVSDPFGNRIEILEVI